MTPREFAIDVARRLQEAGYQGLWAGGCVRDQQLGWPPKDYDVATDARPEEVRELFGYKRTIAIGAAFGVITVLGPKGAGQIEVATFRRDATYSDGRRPDSIEFTDAREDATRRDFTINGMFYDPVKQQLIDYVEGRADLDCRIVRAIGNPHERLDEDKLRMLRAIRFAATFNFDLESETRAAIIEHAPEIKIVSPERIGQEMRRMLGHEHRAVAARLLQECKLLPEVLEKGELLYENRANWRTRLRWMEALGAEGSFEQAAAIMLSRLLKAQGIGPTAQRWKLSNAESKSIQWIENHLLTLSQCHQLPWSKVQPLLVHDDAPCAVKVAEIQFGPQHAGIQICQQRLAWPPEKLDPSPLITGDDLLEIGISQGPKFSKILTAVRTAQLDEKIMTRDQAIEMAKQIDVKSEISNL